MTDKKKPKGDSAAPRQPTGDMLREAREAAGLTVEDISAAINIRAAQIRAIEENNLEALPGMIYAAGFVKSYANYLKLDGNAFSARFKAEHGGAQGAHQAELHFPEPIDENKLPNMAVIGAAVVALVVVAVLWSIFSGGDGGEDVAAIQPPPAIAAPETASVLPADGAITPPAATGVMPEAPLPVAGETPAAEPAPETPPAVAAPETPPPAAVAVTPPAPAEETPSSAAEAPAPVAETPPAPEPIEVRNPSGRIVLTAVETAWVQVNDGQNVLFKKVLRPGEKYNVPDRAGLSLTTSNAGGLAVFVDGKKTQDIGRTGEIRRGVPLDAESLKKRRVRVNNY